MPSDPHDAATPEEAAAPAGAEALFGAETGKPQSMRQIAITWGLAFVVLGAFVMLFLHVGDVEVFIATIRSADPWWIVVAVLCQLATYVFAAMVWHVALMRAKVRQSILSLLNLAVLELFANQAVPTGGLSGAILVVHGLVRRGVDAALATTALLVAYVSYYLAYLAVGLVAFFLLWSLGDLSDTWLGLLVIFVVVVAALAAGLVLIVWSRGRFIPANIRQWAPIARLEAVMRRVRMGIIADPRVLLQAFFWQAGIFLLDAATLYAAARAVGAEADFGAAFISFMIASIIATLTPVPMGLGTFEGTAAGLLHFLGSGVEAGLAATLILRGLTLWLPMLPGLWLMRREGKRK